MTKTIKGRVTRLEDKWLGTSHFVVAEVYLMPGELSEWYNQLAPHEPILTCIFPTGEDLRIGMTVTATLEFEL